MLVRIFYSQNRYTLPLPFMLWGQEMHASAVKFDCKGGTCSCMEAKM